MARLRTFIGIDPGKAIRDRLVALSDGVFAVAMTLMSFDVVAKGTSVEPGQDLAGHLLAQWPVYAAYLVGFMTKPFNGFPWRDRCSSHDSASSPSILRSLSYRTSPLKT